MDETRKLSFRRLDYMKFFFWRAKIKNMTKNVYLLTNLKLKKDKFNKKILLEGVGGTHAPL